MVIWKQAIAAAKAGKKAEARELFLQISQAEPENDRVWHWLTFVSDSLKEKVRYLKRVLSINPENAKAKTAYRRILFRQGVTAARSDRKTLARRLFKEVAALNPFDEKVFLWQAVVAADNLERKQCLEKVLSLNPTHPRAVIWMEKVLQALAVTRPVWQCPLCEHRHFEKPKACPSCVAQLSLEDIDALVNAQVHDRGVIERAIRRLDIKYQNSGSFEDCYHLGMAYLNLNDLSRGLELLRRAGSMRPEEEALNRAVAQLIARRDPLKNPEEPSISEGQKGTILAVDDSSTVRKLVAITLERHGYDVITAADGIQALARVHEIVPDLIFLDVNMPGMDGYQICRIIRENENTRHIPVLMLSGKDGMIDKIRGRRAGAVDYLTKPFEGMTLVHAIEKHLKR